MHVTTQTKRKVRARLLKFFVLSTAFFLTLTVCGTVLEILYPDSGIISPIKALLFQQANNDDSLVASVKDWCQTTHANCLAVATQKDAIVVILDHNQTVYLSKTKDLKKQLASLQLALSEFTIKGKQFKTLDFRFSQSVVTF